MTYFEPGGVLVVDGHGGDGWRGLDTGLQQPACGNDPGLSFFLPYEASFQSYGHFNFGGDFLPDVVVDRDGAFGEDGLHHQHGVVDGC